MGDVSPNGRPPPGLSGPGENNPLSGSGKDGVCNAIGLSGIVGESVELGICRVGGAFTSSVTAGGSSEGSG